MTEEVEPGVERIISDDAGHDLDETHPTYRARDRRGATTAAQHRSSAPRTESPSPVSAIASIGLMALQNDDGRGSVLGVRDRSRAERSPSAKSGLPKVGSMTTPSAEYGCVLPGCATCRYPVQLALTRAVN